MFWNTSWNYGLASQTRSESDNFLTSQLFQQYSSLKLQYMKLWKLNIKNSPVTNIMSLSTSWAILFLINYLRHLALSIVLRNGRFCVSNVSVKKIFFENFCSRTKLNPFSNIKISITFFINSNNIFKVQYKMHLHTHTPQWWWWWRVCLCVYMCSSMEYGIILWMNI